MAKTNTDIIDIFYLNSIGNSEQNKPHPHGRGLPIHYFPLSIFYSIFPVNVAIFNSPIAFVMGISRGQAIVQL